MAFVNSVQQNDNTIVPSTPVVSPLYMQSTTVAQPVLNSTIQNVDTAQITSNPKISVVPQTDGNISSVSNQTLSVDSIISEISQNLNINEPLSENTNLSNEPVSEPTINNLVQYTSNAEDTFQENYKNHIEVNTPIQIDSSDLGVKEIKSIDSNIPNSIVNEGALLNKLQYKSYTLTELLNEATNRKASDIHLTPGYRATFRIDGSLKTFNSPILTPQNVKDYATALIKNRKDMDLENAKELDLTFAIGNKRFRVNIFKQMGVHSIVCRVINENVLGIDALGLPESLTALTKFPNGLILLTGPTGSGKSTTLASLLNYINMSEAKHIITLEDPVEYILPKSLSLIDQREFGTDFNSWPNALRSVLRQDPDIVLIGEMRDLESIEAALRVAETGHLVFATLHTNSAAQSIDRIIDIFPADKQAQIRVQLASVIRAVVSQRLIPLSTGGRQPAVELVLVNNAVQNAIRENKVFLIDNIIQTSAEEGMMSLEKSLVQMVKEGLISAQTAKNFSVKPSEVEMLLSK